jgi:hypothetical protein
MPDEPSIREAHLLVGPLFSEPMQVEMVRQGAPGTWIVSLAGSLTQQFRRVTLTRTIFGFSELSIRSAPSMETRRGGRLTDGVAHSS